MNMTTINKSNIKPCIHFVGFRGEEYNSAVKIWGKPDFFHKIWDHRAVGDIVPDLDTVIFAKYSPEDKPSEYSYDDSAFYAGDTYNA
jgi:hypothetical protein